MENNETLKKALQLLELYRSGALGGERMPEDANPGLPADSRENALYFTLPMALNYQRNSYKLWESAKKCFEDPETRSVFEPKQVVNMDEALLRERLVRYGVALQPNRQPQIWRRLCQTFQEDFDGDVRRLFAENCDSVERIRAYFAANKKRLPYLGGAKILNYWMYVMEQRCGVMLEDREKITIAPDTHVLQASVQLGLLGETEFLQGNVQMIAAKRWHELLDGSGYLPIDLHTPLWLWSRGGFKVEL